MKTCPKFTSMVIVVTQLPFLDQWMDCLKISNNAETNANRVLKSSIFEHGTSKKTCPEFIRVEFLERDQSSR
jgi:hypothetical protein